MLGLVISCRHATDDNGDGDGATDDDDNDDDNGDNCNGTAADDNNVNDDDDDDDDDNGVNDVDDVNNHNLPPRVGKRNDCCNKTKPEEEGTGTDSVAIHTTIKQITRRGGGR